MTEQQKAAEADAVMTRIGQAIMLLHAGDREEARNRLGVIWAEFGRDTEPLHRCTLAHYMADAQDDPADELAWDLRALNAADELGDGRPARRGPAVAVRAFYPSLHLNLAADYLKLQRRAAARVHLDRARSACAALPDDTYTNGVRVAIGRLERRLESGRGDTGPGPYPGRFT